MKRNLPSCLIFSTLLSILQITSPSRATAQELRLVEGEMTTCRIIRTVSSGTGTANSSSSKSRQVAPAGATEKKVYEPLLNQVGSFDRLADILPSETLGVELTYPDGKPGEQVVVSVEDGGSLEKEKKVGVYHLDRDKKISFAFTVSKAPGLYRLAARKEFETRTVQLWVGAEPRAVD